ncbi:MAG TPA: amidohydrolase family protein [Candidatus Eisenbacteria bacterium]|nr:amidohydrolase family protein [Candidatus Eisenbacteria bacterium]
MTSCPRSPRRPVLLALLLAVLLAPVRGHAAEPKTAAGGTPVWVFENVTIVPMDRDGVVPDRTVVVQGDRIASIEPSGRAKTPPGAVRIDGRGKYLIPGLADMHIHLAQGPGAVSDPAGRQLRLLLANGITTARVLIPSPMALEVRDRIARGEQIGPRLVVYSPSLNANTVTGPEQAAGLVEEYANRGFEGIKTHGGLERPEYDAMMAAAARRKLPVSGHVTSQVGLERALEAKQQIEHLDGYLAALVPEQASIPPLEGQFVLEDQELREIDESRIASVVAATRAAGIANSPTLALFATLVSDEEVNALAMRPEMKYAPRAAVAGWSQQVAAFPGRQVPIENRRRYTRLRDRLVRELDKAGCPILAGSDSPQIFMVPGFALHRELEALVAAGLSPYAALTAATRNPHRYLGDPERGTIAPSQKADLVLLDGNPLEDIRNASRVSGVLTGGAWHDAARLRSLLDEVERSARGAG